MELDVVDLSRAQFALTVMFHYLFPPLSIGLGVIMVVLEGLALRTGDDAYERATRWWTKVFAVNFAVGVASGIVMEFQFGTNWATYSRFVGDVFGSALASEGIFAFFLESGFLAILVFGWDRVSKKMHFFSTIMVSLGSIFSAVWIVIANSWQQTPRGFHLVGEGAAMRAEITDFWAMIFNPSAMHRLNHVLLGSFVQGAFFVMSIAAFYLLKKRHEDFAKKSFRVALGLGTAASLALLVSGHAQASAVAVNQPAKMAAFEGHFETGPGDLYVLGIPNAETKTVDYGVAVPGMLSVLLHGDPEAEVTGLDAIPEDEHPPLVVPFAAYHLMVALGTLFIAMTVLASVLLWRGTLWNQKWLLRAFVLAVAGPVIANQTGWVAAEVGRQPWVVYGLLKTVDAVSTTVPGEHVLASLILFGIVYLALGAVWIFVVNEKIQHGPQDAPLRPSDGSGSFLEVAAEVTDPAAPTGLATFSDLPPPNLGEAE
ncbi:MAG: cytochrome ubiquinol oxidase subunit I [Myxococcota bacterium]